ncbi:NUDIX hydrolase [Streptomyces odonnellii]|uniref:hypothetical protein n=1 Tax=Streptomyces odonnellii TaxID=1417980 RepID=UPI000625857D|nr:hypothetical protein [Streptomyces odonnellii]
MADPSDWRSRFSHLVVVDIRTGAVGRLLRTDGGLVVLQPVTGGEEWTAPADLVRPATPAEVAAALADPE